MNRQQQIDAFTLEAHRLIVARLYKCPEGLQQARATLQRWRKQEAHTLYARHFDQWEELLEAGTDAIEAATCSETERATKLRSFSPLGSLMTQSERMQLLKQSRTL